MTGALVVAISALAGIFGLLLGFILVRRLRADRRRHRLERMRPPIETDLAMYLADPDADPPEPPASDEGRHLFRDVAVEALVELRGRERERLSGLLDAKGIVDETSDELSARRRLTRLHAAEFLAEMHSRRAADALLIGLLDTDPDVRLACARALAELGDESFVEPLIAAADTEADDRAGAAAAVLLSVGTKEPDGLGAAIEESRATALRRLAAAVIAELRLAQFAPQLRVALASDDDELVARAARGLGTIGDVDSVDELLSLLEDDERAAFCRVVAANALGAIGDPRVVPALAGALEDGDWLMQNRAAAALALLGEPGRVALERARSSSGEDARAHAGVALDQ